jgi:hypothetical protein
VLAQRDEGVGQVGDGVVVVGHRAVTGGAAGSQSHPGDALLARLDQVQTLAADLGGESADLADGLGAALEEVGPVLGDPVRTLAPTGLLVGGEHQRDRPVGDDAGPLPRAHRRQQHRVEVLHVDGATTEQVAVDDLGGERVDLPVGGSRRHDVEMAVDEEPGLG